MASFNCEYSMCVICNAANYRARPSTTWSVVDDVVSLTLDQKGDKLAEIVYRFGHLISELDLKGWMPYNPHLVFNQLEFIYKHLLTVSFTKASEVCRCLHILTSNVIYNETLTIEEFSWKLPYLYWMVNLNQEPNREMHGMLMVHRLTELPKL
jgi:hypothetical protein